MISVADEPLSTLADPLPLPPYHFDTSLSEDENFLTWCTILARHSNSKKGHMGTIFVRPPTTGDPSSSGNECQPSAQERILQYANNVPLLYASSAAAVPEIHAEALAISRCARRGIALEGCTVYISFPPCNDCMKLLLAVGVRRCVFKKAVLPHTAQGEAALVAAEAERLTLIGTTDEIIQGPARGDDDATMHQARAKERAQEEARDLRVRGFWSGVGETAERTRARVARWWDEGYWPRYREAERTIKERYGDDSQEALQKRKLMDKEDKRLNRQRSKALRKQQAEQQRQISADTSSNGVAGNNDDGGEDAMDREFNDSDAHRKRPSVERNGGSPSHKVTKFETDPS